MNFDEKVDLLLTHLQSRISPANISPKYLRHYICDFLELYTFFYQEAVTKSEIIDLFDDHRFNLATVGDQNISGLSQSEIDDKKEEEVIYLFQCLEYRSDILSEKYPFSISNNSITLKDTLSFSQKIYLVFLFGSNLSIFSEFESSITSEFEHISFCILKTMFSANTEIKQFGKNSDYTGTAREKIKELARDMYLKVDDEAINSIPRSNQQERGLDVIAWIPYKDNIANNMLVYLIQCACGKTWTHKFSEVFRYLDYFQFKSFQPVGVMAISYGLNIMGRFEQNDDIVSSKSLILDRFRLMEFVQETDCYKVDSLISVSLVERLNTSTINLS